MEQHPRLEKEVNRIIEHFESTEEPSVKSLWIVGPSAGGKSHVADSVGDHACSKAFSDESPKRILPSDENFQAEIRNHSVIIVDEAASLLKPGNEAKLQSFMEAVDAKKPNYDTLYIVVAYADSPAKFRENDQGWNTRIGFCFEVPFPEYATLAHVFNSLLEKRYQRQHDAKQFKVSMPSNELANDQRFQRLSDLFIFRLEKALGHVFYAQRNKRNELTRRGMSRALDDATANAGNRINIPEE